MNQDEHHLLKLFRALPEANRASLVDYAEFLHARCETGETEAVPQQPLGIARPDKETVVNAIKRLTANYPMLEREKLLNETAGLMTQHVLYKRPAQEVIDELEAVFLRHFEAHAGDQP